MGGRGVRVATSHLESPCGWNQLYSKQRVAQCKQVRTRETVISPAKQAGVRVGPRHTAWCILLLQSNCASGNCSALQSGRKVWAPKMENFGNIVFC